MHVFAFEQEGDELARKEKKNDYHVNPKLESSISFSIPVCLRKKCELSLVFNML